MYSEIISTLLGTKFEKWQTFLRKSQLVPDPLVDKTVILWDGDNIAATGSRYDNILKLIAVDESYRGDDLTSTVISELRRDAFNEGYRNLFLYTKPQNNMIFSSLFFYPIAETEKILLLEDKKNGIGDFIASLPRAKTSQNIGSVVMNCNPFTLGHQYLIEYASKQVDVLIIFVVEENKSYFKFEDRIELVKQGTAHLDNVYVVPSGKMIISTVTFPGYFLKDTPEAVGLDTSLDVSIFGEYIAKAFGIKTRFVGEEPLDIVTRNYNESMKKILPLHGIELVVIPRKEMGESVISASRVRKLLESKDFEGISELVPETTYKFLVKNYK